MLVAVTQDNTEPRICIAVSRCLLGDVVRYDARKKRDHFIADTLGRHFCWAAICPEVEIGLGVPRPKIQLERSGGADYRLVMPEGNRDLTHKMLAHCRRLARRLRKQRVCGCLLKSRSPSCGLSRVKTYSSDGRMRREGVGFFARTIQDMMPGLPVEEDDRMHDPSVRDNWIERVFAYERLQRLFDGRRGIADLTAFHDAHRLTLLSHGARAFADLSRLLDGKKPTSTLRESYGSAFMAALRRPATRARNASVLRRILAALKPGLDADAYRRLAEQIADYRQGGADAGLPLSVPRSLLAHYARVLDIPELRNQAYLRPTDAELALRNHS